MGRRKGRKRRDRRERESLGAEALRRSERRRKRRPHDDRFADPIAPPPQDDDPPATLAWRERGPRSLVAMMHGEAEPGAKPAPTCGACHEFVPGDTGRGRCLHPGSGVLAPWPDTDACQFHEPRRR